MYNPVSTYRIQFHKDFRFSDLKKRIPYLHSLGIKTIYAAPIFRSVPGSVHGYDVTDANTINPEIGTEAELYELRDLLRSLDMGWIQDIVPNHMALHPDNMLLMDVLQRGRDSVNADFFDIDWDHPDATNKVLLPILADDLTVCLDQDLLQLEGKPGAATLRYADWTLPINEESQSLAATLMKAKPAQRRERLPELLRAQYYELRFWQDSSHTGNYRRFFTINGLIALNMQSEDVFSRYHELIAKLCRDEVFQGLRVDHVDGLYDPSAYLYRLRTLVGPDLYIVVEKILQEQETLPSWWPVQGTTGYEFLSSVNGVLSNKRAKRVIDRFYRAQQQLDRPIEAIRLACKKMILENDMQAELSQLLRLAVSLRPLPVGIREDTVKAALATVLIQTPVYKYYVSHFPLEASDKQQIRSVTEKIKDEAVRAYVEYLLIGGSDADQEEETSLHFYRRLMQFTGPLMAKGVEDTFMFRWYAYPAHNEVGDDPLAQGFSVKQFHERMILRQKNQPLTLNALSTHDTKRGADARARLLVLGDSGADGIRLVESWLSAHKKNESASKLSFNDRYFIYITLISSFPLEEEAEYTERLKACLIKSVREAKVHSNWAAPDNDYEAALFSFTESLLSDPHFVKELRDFLRVIDTAVVQTSLSQLTLQYTCPGVPDCYQGTELQDFSMVDPDNRRAVDYARREHLLNELQSMDVAEQWSFALQAGHSELLKLYMRHRLLFLRKQYPDLFAKGTYEPLQVQGAHRKHILAFARHYRNQCCVVVCGIHLQELATQQGRGVLEIDWADTELVLPKAYQQWVSLPTGAITEPTRRVTALFTNYPLAIFNAVTTATERGAGVLLPVFSLPGDYGIGDFGPAAYRFVDCLRRSGQRFWQVLPLNPVLAGQSYSPYSSDSAMAGNPMMISPELLYEAGLIASTQPYKLPAHDTVDYDRCRDTKAGMLREAYETFTRMRYTSLEYDFLQFCKQEAYWLDDYALLVALRDYFDGDPWYQWPPSFRDRDQQTLVRFSDEHRSELEWIRWIQFIADKQWKELHDYCRSADVTIIGDIPFYVSQRAADVWANRDIFALDEAGNMLFSGGVPPDYFSRQGQLWCLPTYRWDVLKRSGYDWWMKRLLRNIQQFDLLRLDHFRAFAAYWEVPADKQDATEGTWREGPALHFFDTLRQLIPQMPFIAEDLGEEMDEVYRLRDEVGIPGMKVLQFAWGANMPHAVDAPHNFEPNFVVYTGTHDNNTTKGWLAQEADEEAKARLRLYAGAPVRKSDIAWLLTRMAYSSVARIAIIPYADLIQADQNARINTPGTDTGNWVFRLTTDFAEEPFWSRLYKWSGIYGRR